MKLRIYKTNEGYEPFTVWMRGLTDRTAKQRIEARINRILDGNIGDSRNVGNGVCELKIPHGPGYRVYFGREENLLVVLLCGGNKKTQCKDIIRAKKFWSEYKQEKEL